VFCGRGVLDGEKVGEALAPVQAGGRLDTSMVSKCTSATVGRQRPTLKGQDSPCCVQALAVLGSKTLQKRKEGRMWNATKLDVQTGRRYQSFR